MSESIALKGKELPNLWKSKRLGDIAKIFAGSSAPQEIRYFLNGKNPFVRVSDLGASKITSNLTKVRDYVTDECVEKEKLVFAKKGTLLFPKSGAAILTNNRALLGIDAYIVSHLAAIEPKEGKAISKWLFYSFRQLNMLNYCENPGYPSLKLSRLSKIMIPVPPIEEQQKIVDKLDKQMAQIEMMKTEAEEQMEAANYYYRSYLLKVFSEKANWQFKKFGSLFNTKYGLSKPSVRDSSKTKALRMTNINYEGELILDDICYLDLSDDELKQHKLKKNDLIFNRTNSADLVGKTTVFDQENTFVSVSYLVVATPKTPEINSKFVSFYLNTSEMKKYFIENCDKAISQANFSASKLCEIQIPVPDKKTQDKIVGSIQTAKTELMKVSEPIKSQLDAINQLPASILNEVFGQYQINS